MSLLSNLSIVIPTFNRQEYAIRAMHYWKNYDVKVLILDGSKDPIKQSVISSIDSNINYYFMPISLMERLYKSTELVKTSYSIMMADDEFFIPSALDSCIKELKKDPEIVSCMGSAISFLFKDKKILTNEIYPDLRNHLVNQETPLERSIYHMSAYTPSSIYSVMRTEIWKKSIRALSYKNFEFYVKSIGEIQFEITSSYLGKYKIINELMWLRSFENEPIRVHVGEASVPIKDFWYKESNKSIRDEIIDAILQSIASEEDNMSHLKQDISQAFDAYIKITQQSFKYRSVEAILPKSIMTLIVRLLRFMKSTEKNSLLSISNITSILYKKGIKVDIDALNEIEKKVLDFHSK
jgi:glycosyltransferase domain-containing protein